jgi:hypothetical protein
MTRDYDQTSCRTSRHARILYLGNPTCGAPNGFWHASSIRPNRATTYLATIEVRGHERGSFLGSLAAGE